MKIVGTEFNKKVNASSSYIIYIMRSKEAFTTIYGVEMAHREMVKDNGDWYYTVSGRAAVGADCRVPEFFHGEQYMMVCVEHNNGNWDLEQSYKLYIVE